MASCLLALPTAQALAGQDSDHRLAVDGRIRFFSLHVPDRRSGWPVKLPLVIALHGDAGNSRQMRRITQLNTPSDREGFIVVYPQGSGWAGLPPYGWNAGTCCGYAADAAVDDVRFVSRLIETLIENYPVDARRVFAAGFSNGGMMAHRLACELSEKVAAIAVVSGALTTAVCNPARPVPVLIFHGTKDGYVPYEGGNAPESKGRVDPSVETTADFWRARNRCRDKREVMVSGDVQRTVFSGCARAADVVLYTLTGASHAWPGGRRGWRFGSLPPRDISASPLLWQFFREHPLPEGADKGESVVNPSSGLLK